MDDNDLLQHLKDAEVIEFDIKNDEPASGVKHMTDAGQTGWAPIGVMRNRHSSGSRSGEYDVARVQEREASIVRRLKSVRGSLVGKHPSSQDLPFFQPLLLLEPTLG